MARLILTAREHAENTWEWALSRHSSTYIFTETYPEDESGGTEERIALTQGQLENIIREGRPWRKLYWMVRKAMIR